MLITSWGILGDASSRKSVDRDLRREVVDIADLYCDLHLCLTRVVAGIASDDVKLVLL